MYKTDNIAIAAGLRTQGFSLDKIDLNGKRATFIFKDEAQEPADKILSGQLLVDAMTFHHEIRRLSGLARAMFDKGV